MKELAQILKESKDLSEHAGILSQKVQKLALYMQSSVGQANSDTFMMLFTVFILACFIGYYVVWNVTPALHTPLMSVTNAISGIIVVAGIVTLGVGGTGMTQILGLAAIVLASINIFGGFIVTQRMLAMFKKKR